MVSKFRFTALSFAVIAALTGSEVGHIPRSGLEKRAGGGRTPRSGCP
jgi:hypothetical protein